MDMETDIAAIREVLKQYAMSVSNGDYGKALTLYQRQSDGSWKIIYDCYNSSVPGNPA